MNTQILEITIPGKADTKHRPRAVINPKTGRPIVYGVDAFAENRIVSYMKHLFPAKLVEGPIMLTLTFVYPYPGWLRSKAKEVAAKLGTPYFPKTSKPDGDNLVKFVKDSLNKFFWKDDSQVYASHIYKYYGPDPDPYTIIKIEYTTESMKDWVASISKEKKHKKTITKRRS